MISLPHPLILLSRPLSPHTILHNYTRAPATTPALQLQALTSAVGAIPYGILVRVWTWGCDPEESEYSSPVDAGMRWHKEEQNEKAALARIDRADSWPPRALVQSVLKHPLRHGVFRVLKQVHRDTGTRAHAHAHARACMHTCICMCAHTCTHTLTHTLTHMQGGLACMRIRRRVHACMYKACVHTCR